mmetsp:Transcript_30026/g.69952  ORF Transcript_30026/g.69952 Transcript_30026/m.69952 type:complete len:303 (-) Transcript_30026:425-1333(-)
MRTRLSWTRRSRGRARSSRRCTRKGSRRRRLSFNTKKPVSPGLMTSLRHEGKNGRHKRRRGSTAPNRRLSTSRSSVHADARLSMTKGQPKSNRRCCARRRRRGESERGRQRLNARRKRLRTGRSASVSSARRRKLVRLRRGQQRKSDERRGRRSVLSKLQRLTELLRSSASASARLKRGRNRRLILGVVEAIVMMTGVAALQIVVAIAEAEAEEARQMMTWAPGDVRKHLLDQTGMMTVPVVPVEEIAEETAIRLQMPPAARLPGLLQTRKTPGAVQLRPQGQLHGRSRRRKTLLQCASHSN